MKIIWTSALLAIAIVVVSLVPGPYASTRQAAPGGLLLETALLDAQSTAVIQRACGDCHSNQTRWPWYSRVPPVSWLLQKDVHDGRAFLNFSRWPEYGAAGQSQLLSSAVEDLRAGTMPPQRYLLLHPDAKLSHPERAGLIAALQRELSRIAQSAPTNP